MTVSTDSSDAVKMVVSLTFTPVILQEISSRTDAPVGAVQILTQPRTTGAGADQTLVDVWAEEHRSMWT